MTPSKPFYFLSFLGRSGSGKGTQAKFLAEEFNLLHVSSGDLLRERAKHQDFLGRKIEETLGAGKLMTSVVIQLWMPLFNEIKEKQEKGELDINGLILDGSPRKFYEAHFLNESLGWYEWADNFRAVVFNLSKEEALIRLLARGRSDDERSKIEERLGWFDTEVQPVIDFYAKLEKVVGVNAGQTRKDVYKELKEKLRLT